jgi:archaemetzincin
MPPPASNTTEPDARPINGINGLLVTILATAKNGKYFTECTAIVPLSLVMSKLLLQLVALQNKDGQHRAGYGKDNDLLLKHTADQLNIIFHPAAGISMLKPIKQIPDFTIDMHRRQCISDLLLDWLSDITFKNDDKQLANHVKLLALCNFDAYSSGLNFVFGQAHMKGKVAAIYLPRLKQEFYGLEKNEKLFLQRVVKEAVHELGHAFGLGHCSIQLCVMHFSNSLADTDAKAKDFCQNCSSRINL